MGSTRVGRKPEGKRPAKKSPAKRSKVVKDLGGRPTKYRSEYAEQGRKLCLLGATDNELADFFEISESTLNVWKIEHAEFAESLRRGKMVADANVGERLYERAMGYSHPEEKIFCDTRDGKVTRAETTRHYPPDTTAAIFWLKNRQKSRWRDRHDVAVENDIPPVIFTADISAGAGPKDED
jgi:hypothetical protein